MGAPDQEENDPLIGTSFADRYQLTGRLGKGGMAVVYRAVDKNLGREVALKVLRKDVAGDPIAAKRLIREARAAAALHHPHIITIHDVGEKDGTVYVVMEVLVGRALSDVMEEAGALGVERSLNIAEQMASALSVAHAQNIIHRDIKPENLYLLEAGGGDFVKLLDFSIAKLPTEMVTAALTRAGSVFGTPHYMAPEQVEGKGVGPQTDLYALGAVLYEMIIGEPPYDGPSIIDILLKHVKSPPPSLLGRGLKLPNGLSEFVQQLMAKKQADRPATASFVRDEIGRMLSELRHSHDGERATASVEATASPRETTVIKPIVAPFELALPAAYPVRQALNTMLDAATAPASASAVHASVASSEFEEVATIAVDTAAVTAGVVAARAKAISAGISPVAAMKAETKMDLITEVTVVEELKARHSSAAQPGRGGQPADQPGAPALPEGLSLPDLPTGPPSQDKRKFAGFGADDHGEQRTIVGVGLGRMVAEIAKQRAGSGANSRPNAPVVAPVSPALADAPTAAAPVAAVIAAAAVPPVRSKSDSANPTSSAPSAAAVAAPGGRPASAARPPPPPNASAAHTRRPPARVAQPPVDDRAQTQPGLGVDAVAPVTVTTAAPTPSAGGAQSAPTQLTQAAKSPGHSTKQVAPETHPVIQVSKISGAYNVAPVPTIAISTRLMLMALGLFAACAVVAALWVLLR